MSNGVFSLNFLALLLSEILGGSQIYTRGPYAPVDAPSGEIYVRGALCPRLRHLAEIFLYPRRVRYHV